MKRQDYIKAINRTTLECWGIILCVLLVSYSIEVIRGTRNIPYFIIFCLLIIIPYIGAVIFNKKKHGRDLNIKYIFVISYMILYSFVLLTTKTFVTYVYVIPMASILVAYCDRNLTFYMFIYVILLNLLSVIIQYNQFVDSGSQLIFGMKDRITMWEIQIALISLSGIFLSKTCKLIKKRDDILDSLEDDIYKDELTGIFNKRLIKEQINGMFKSRRDKSVAFIDVDDFKKFNTLYGHTFGDEVLITLCNIINNNLKDYKDTYLIRVGGDEFIIFSLDFNSKDFKDKLEKIVKNVSKTKIPFGNKKVGVNISVGMACTDKDRCKTFMDLYNLADDRNATAKKNGKNCVQAK